MGHADDIAIEQARALLYSGGRRNTERMVDAHRVMAQAYPRSYTTKFVECLLGYYYSLRDQPELELRVTEEAAENVRLVPESEPFWPELHIRALHAYASQLQLSRRFDDALTVLEELDRHRRRAVVAGRLRSSNVDHDAWPTALAQAGRYSEAAEVLRDILEFERSLTYPTGIKWTIIQLSSALEASGQFDEAIAVFEEFETSGRSKLYALAHLARLQHEAGHHPARLAALEEALALLASCDGQVGYEDFYLREFLQCSLRADDVPGYSYGSAYWQSPRLRARFIEEADALEAAAADLPSGPDRVVTFRRATVRRASALLDRFQDRYRRLVPYFDRGVELAGEAVAVDPVRGPDLLTQALLDRAQYRAAASDFAGSYSDFSEVVSLVRSARP